MCPSQSALSSIPVVCFPLPLFCFSVNIVSNVVSWFLDFVNGTFFEHSTSLPETHSVSVVSENIWRLLFSSVQWPLTEVDPL
jgi:hypothetical protein